MRDTGTRRKSSLTAVLDNPRLPSPPAVVLQIVDKASRPDCDPDEILTLLSQDSGLCCQVLKTVNSGLFGLAKPVGSLKQAIMLLGLKPLRSLVLSLALPAVHVADKDELILKYWQESVAGAVIARELARHLRRREPEDDLVAGLLRDLGILVLREAFPDDYRALWSACASDWSARQCDAEKDKFGVDHTEIGAGLLHAWNLPPEIYQSIQFHHNPAGCPDAGKPIQERAWLLHFASKVATLDAKAPQAVSELLQIAQAQFAMNQDALIKFLASVGPAIREFAGLLRVDIGSVPNYASIISTGCQELIRLSVETSKASKVEQNLGLTPNVHALAESGRTTKPGLHKRTFDAPQTVAPAANGTNALPDFDISFLDKMRDGGCRLNDYELQASLGRGGRGVVFKANDPALNRFAAIKMLTPQFLVSADARERFKREARAVAAIQHESVITIYAVSEVHSLPYLVMEYLPGATLQDRVDKEGAVPLGDVIRYGRQIASGLAAAHQRRVIHRDIKPANILLGRDAGSIKITDFGLARDLDESTRLSQDGTMVGTPLFMAPEQFSGKNVDHRADLFSLGSVLYTLAAGKTPFTGDSIMALMQQVSSATPRPLRSIRADVPVWLVNLINKLLAKQPAQRHQSAAEVVAAFDAADKSSSTAAS